MARRRTLGEPLRARGQTSSGSRSSSVADRRVAGVALDVDAAAGCGRATSGSTSCASPSSSIVAGTSTMRTIGRVDEHGDRHAEAEQLQRAVVAEHEGAEHAHHDQRRGGDDPRRDGEAVGDGGGVVAGAVVLLLHPRQEEHLVVHRQAEHDREQHHRRPRLDRAGLVDADQAHAPAPLEDGDDHAVGRADRQQVHDHGLQRHEQAAEHDHQQQERQDQHGADQQRAAGRAR